MKTLMSPKLKRGHGYWNTEWVNYTNEPWFCMDMLNNYVHIPAKTEHIWVEASNEQWDDDSGIPIVLNKKGYWITYRENEKDRTFYSDIVNIINRKKFVLDGSTVVYFRVWYV